MTRTLSAGSRQVKFEANLTHGILIGNSSNIYQAKYVITMTLQIPNRLTKTYTFRPTCVEDKFGYNDFLSCICPSGKIKTNGDADAATWICGDPPTPSNEPCSEAFKMSDSLYDQFTECYKFNNNDGGRCKFSYGSGIGVLGGNKCEEETKLDCSQMNLEYATYPISPITPFTRLTGWKILSKKNQKTICENVYSKRRGLKCKLYTGTDNECGFSDNLVIFNLIVPDPPLAGAAEPSKSFEYIPDKAVKSTLCDGSPGCQTTIYESGIYLETMQQLYSTMGINYIGVSPGKFTFKTHTEYSTFHLVINTLNGDRPVAPFTTTKCLSKTTGCIGAWGNIEKGSFITSIFISGRHLN